MQKRFVDVTEEIKILVTQNQGFGTVNVVYQGDFGFEIAAEIPPTTDWQGVLSAANKIANYPTTMQSLRDGQRLARLACTLFLEQGITRTACDLHALGMLLRVRHNGETRQASPDDLPFPYDRPTQPLSDRRYSIEGNQLHLQLDNDDQIAFIGTLRAGRPWNTRHWVFPLLTDFAVKRLFEIYKSDTSSFSHLAWVQDLNFSADLGL